MVPFKNPVRNAFLTHVVAYLANFVQGLSLTIDHGWRFDRSWTIIGDG